MATTKSHDVVVDDHEHPRKNRVEPIDESQRQVANQEMAVRAFTDKPRRKIENVDRNAIRDNVNAFIDQALAAELEDGQQHVLVIALGPQGYTSTPKMNEKA